MTLLATGIGLWPRDKWEVKPCRNCRDKFLGERREKYCQRPACQEAKSERERRGKR